MASTNVLVAFLSLTDTARLLRSYVEYAYAAEGRDVPRPIGLLTLSRIDNALAFLEAALAEEQTLETLKPPGEGA